MRIEMFSVISASVISAVMLAGTAAPAAPPRPIHLEAADARLDGVTIATAIPGYTGRGYVGNFAHQGDKIVFTLPNAKPGIYSVSIRYSAPLGEKGYDLVVNGVRSSGILPKTGNAFATHPAGKVELLAGQNMLAVERGWGYYSVNALDLRPAPPPLPLPKPPFTLSDPQASAGTRALMRRLIGLYGVKTLSGQYENADNNYIHTVTGKMPAIYGDDFIEYSPSRVAHGAKPVATDRMLARAKGGQIITASWHWNAPSGLLDREITDARGKAVDARWYKGFYTNATTFDVQKALANPKSPEYALLLRDMDVIAAQLQRLSDAHVTVLWRPLHEAAGGWFWWGARGPGPFKQLWRLMHDRLTKVHHLHNLIWIDCSGGSPNWYPGDAYIDVVGVDAYPSDVTDPLSATWDKLAKEYGGRKLLALTEFGGVPDVPKMRRYGVRPSYFVSWTGDVGPKKNPKDALINIYRSAAVGTEGN